MIFEELNKHKNQERLLIYLSKNLKIIIIKKLKEVQQVKNFIYFFFSNEFFDSNTEALNFFFFFFPQKIADSARSFTDAKEPVVASLNGFLQFKYLYLRASKNLLYGLKEVKQLIFFLFPFFKFFFFFSFFLSFFFRDDYVVNL